MKLCEVLDNLCYYDTRNPDCQIDYDTMQPWQPPRTGCFCDNCFSGRDKLAVELLKYISE